MHLDNLQRQIKFMVNFNMKTKKIIISVVLLFLYDQCHSQAYLDKNQKQIVQEIYAKGQSSYKIIEQNETLIIFLQDELNVVQFSFDSNGKCIEEMWENSESICNSTKKLLALSGYTFDGVRDGRPDDFFETFVKDNIQAGVGWILRNGTKHWFSRYRHNS